MTDGLDRAELISLLETLGSGDDAEVLAAARAIDARVAEAGTTWDALLAAEADAAEADDVEPAEEEPAEPAALPADEAGKNAESLAIIAKLLARSGQSDALRQELEGYKTDIAEGEFTDADHNYLRALAKRLGR